MTVLPITIESLLGTKIIISVLKMTNYTLNFFLLSLNF